MSLFEDKTAVLSSYKTEFIEGHPIWGVKNIPNPEWSDIKWLRSVESYPPNLETSFYKAARAGQLWRMAKALELRAQLPYAERFDLNKNFKKTTLFHYIAQISTDRVVKYPALSLLVQHGVKKTNMRSYYLSNLIENCPIDFLVLMVKQDMELGDKMLIAAERLAGKGENALLKEKITKDNVNLNNLCYKLLKKGDINKTVIDDLWAKGADQNAVMDLLFDERDDVDDIYKKFDVCIDAGADVQSFLMKHFKNMSAQNILFLQTHGADIYSEGGSIFAYHQNNNREVFHSLCNAKYEAEKNLPSEERMRLEIADHYIRTNIRQEFQTSNALQSCEGVAWEKLDDRVIVKTLERQDGSRLHSYFNFAAGSLEQTQEDDRGVFPLFARKFSDIERDDEIKDAAKALEERGGIPWPTSGKTKNVVALKTTP